MKLYIKIAIACFCIINLAGNKSFAQKSKELFTNQWAGKALKVDGALSEWPDNYWQENKNSQLRFAIANNDSNLYIAIKTINKADFRKILLGGISLSFNTSGKKKAQESLSFAAIRQRGETPSGAWERPIKDPMQRIKEDLANIRSISVNGFATLLDGPIALQNEFGIEAAVKLTEQGELAFEYSLPMKLLQIDALKSDIFAVQFRINGLSPAPGNELRNNMPNAGINGNQMGRPLLGYLSSPDAQVSEFWILSRLANNRN